MKFLFQNSEFCIRYSIFSSPSCPPLEGVQGEERLFQMDIVERHKNIAINIILCYLTS